MRRDIQEMVNGMKKLVQEHNPTPETLRYVFKIVREDTGLVTVKRPKRLPVFLNDDEIEIQ